MGLYLSFVFDSYTLYKITIKESKRLQQFNYIIQKENCRSLNKIIQETTNLEVSPDSGAPQR